MKIEKLNSVFEWREDCIWQCADEISQKINELIDAFNSAYDLNTYHAHALNTHADRLDKLERENKIITTSHEEIKKSNREKINECVDKLFGKFTAEEKEPEIKCDCNCHNPSRFGYSSHPISECPGCAGIKDTQKAFEEAKKVLQPEILPCPFCGIIPKINKNIIELFRIMCEKCHGVYTREYKTEKEAIYAWNRRA